MPTFDLIAKHSENRINGFHIEKGTQITIHINMMGITPNNLFGNNRCKDALVQQFRMNGIDIPPTDAGIYGRGMWEIKMK